MHLLIGCKSFKQLCLANENLRIPEDAISMLKMARIYFKMGDQLFSSQNSDLNNLVASFAPSLPFGANDATCATNKLYTLEKSYDCPNTQHRILVTVEDMVFGHLAPKLHWPV